MVEGSMILKKCDGLVPAAIELDGRWLGATLVRRVLESFSAIVIKSRGLIPRCKCLEATLILCSPSLWKEREENEELFWKEKHKGLFMHACTQIPTHWHTRITDTGDYYLPVLLVLCRASLDLVLCLVRIPIHFGSHETNQNGGSRDYFKWYIYKSFLIGQIPVNLFSSRSNPCELDLLFLDLL